MHEPMSTAPTWESQASAALASDDLPLAVWLDLAAQGISRRRILEQSDAVCDNRAAILGTLTRLQEGATRRLSMDLQGNDGGSISALGLMTQRLDEWLRHDEAYASLLLTAADLETGPGLHRCDAFASDLQWYSALSSLLENEPEPDRLYGIKSRLDHLEGTLANLAASDAASAQQACRDLGREYVDRRLNDELTLAEVDRSPVSLWNRRFQLSRLAADRREFIGSANDERSRLEEIDRKQADLAESAEKLLESFPPLQRGEVSQELLVVAKEEANDVLTMVEDVPLPTAIDLLRSTRSDLVRLSATLARLDKGEDRRPHAPQIRRLARRCGSELSEKKLSLRLESLLSKRGVAWLENLILVLILMMSGLIVAEWMLAGPDGHLAPAQAIFFALADLAICTVFLSEFLLKFTFADNKWSYFKRHFLIDFLPSIPFGFLSHALGSVSVSLADEAPLLRLLRFFRLPQLARYLRVAQPVVRLIRLVIFLLRTFDQIVRRNASVFNRNVVLFEPDALGIEEPGYRLRLARLREHLRRRMLDVEKSLAPAARTERVEQSVADLRIQMSAYVTTASLPPVRRATVGRAVYAEEVVRELVEMTPEELAERLGPKFADAVYRWVGYLDLPLIRHLPMPRDLLAARARGPGEVAALTSNLIGYRLQRFLDLGYFLADLVGTISGPIFLDRLGWLLVSATARNARRLIIFGVSLLLLSGLVWLLQIEWLAWVVTKLKLILALPVLILGAICLVVMLLGQWFRRIANQTSEEGERLVEAQFASLTRTLKQRYGTLDQCFLADRVVAPELYLRQLDDPHLETAPPIAGTAREMLDRAQSIVAGTKPGVRVSTDELLGTNEELLFLRSVALLHRDYQESGLFRPTDTRTSTQLVGNLALSNLRRLQRKMDARETRQLRAIDLARSGGILFGGPHLWFNYITRIITEETAKLLRDYNRHAVPLARLPSAPKVVRERYRNWLAERLHIPVASITLPAPVGTFGDVGPGCEEKSSREGVATRPLFETVDFTTMDFLTDDDDREAEIETRFGSAVVRLLRQDRRRMIRRAFRSFPLHRFPEAYRTINPYSLYLDHVAGGRILLLPLRALIGLIRGIILFTRQVSQTIRDILQPAVEEEPIDEGESFAIALRKIHRMRKPAFMASLWMRARYDIEYLGLAIPGVPLTVGSDSLIDEDLNFIGGTRRERLAAGQMVIETSRRVQSMVPILERLGWNLADLPHFLGKNYPYLAARSAEVTRAIATAWLVDHEEIYSLATSIDSLRQILKSSDPDAPLPSDLADARGISTGSMALLSRREIIEGTLDRLGWGDAAASERKLASERLRRHWSVARPWMMSLRAAPVGVDPVVLVFGRIRDVILRTDLWSDQIVVLRTLQSLSVLDVYHYCHGVWNLGGYGERSQAGFPGTLPMTPDSAATSPLRADGP